MNIAIIGPEKFAFQDMACIELALTYMPLGKFKLLPEPDGGEDATLIWETTPEVTLEVQVKGAEGTAGIKNIAEYLLHYPPHKKTGCLLERLINDKKCFAHFILSARCCDDISSLLLDGSVVGKPVIHAVKNELAVALKSEIARRVTEGPSKDASTLALERFNNLKLIAKRPVTDFSMALSKISLMDSETAETIEVRLHSKLRGERFDSLAIRGVLAGLSDILSEAKRSKTDAFDPLQNFIKHKSPSSLTPENYFERGVEGKLESILASTNCLLLAGPPRTGKSWTALVIAGKLQEFGYEVRYGSYVEEAERFLRESVENERVYVLDDPLGSREANDNAISTLAALQSLCKVIPKNRRLIVSQSEYVLLQLKKASDLSSCKLGDKQWVRLNQLSVEVAQEIWLVNARLQYVPQDQIDIISTLIEEDARLRDPGALTYLAQTWGELPINPNVEDIVLQARKDATDFAWSLASQSQSFKDLMTSTALATTHTQNVETKEIAFIINGEDERPSLTTNLDRIWNLGDDSPPNVPFYLSEPGLTTEQLTGLTTLQRRRVLASIDEKFNFSHPYLRAGAQTLLTPDIPLDLEHILAQLERAILSASPSTSQAAARNLFWLRSVMTNGGLEKVFNIAYQGTLSKYPKTRDVCFEFLVEFSDLLPVAIKNKLPSISERMVLKLEEIDTSNGVGVISSRYELFPKTEPLEKIEPYLNAIEDGSVLSIDMALSRRLLFTLSKHPLRMNHSIVHRFLSADEAAVRAAAAKIWIEYPRSDDDDVLSRIQFDKTPVMAVGLLEKLSIGWKNLEINRRKRLLNIIENYAHSPVCSSVLFTRLVLFDRVEYFSEDPPWEIFALLMPVVLPSLPISISFSDGRFLSVMEAATRFLPTQSISVVLEEWAERILKRVVRFRLDDFELSIVEPLLKTVNSDVRLPIFESLLNVDDSGIRVVTIKGLCNNWNSISVEERDLLKRILQENRLDKRWLTAVVLTRADPPAELVGIVSGDSELLTRSTEEIEQILGQDIFGACISMYVGWPQPLWWYATHHSESSSWKRIIRDLSTSTEHQLYPIVFNEIADFYDESELISLIEETPEHAIHQAFNLLLENKLSHVGDWHSEAWKLLLTKAEKLNILNDLIAKIDLILDGVLEEVGDLVRWLGKDGPALKVGELLKYDILSIKKIIDLNEGVKQMHILCADNKITTPDAVINTLFDQIIRSLEETPPRIYGTWDVIFEFFKTNKAPQSFLDTTAIKRKELLDRHFSIREQYKQSLIPFELPGWVDNLSKDTN